MLTLYNFAEQLVEIDESKVVYFMAFAPGTLAPIAILRLDVTEPAGYVMGLWVDQAHRCKGLASSLLSRAALRTKDDGKEVLGLSVHAENENARRLYERLGFKKYTTGHENYTQYVKFLA
jgi:ribosomal protein S18 acetylase RimI-like enzyme